MTGPINTDTIRANAGAQGPMSDRTRVLALCDEVDSLRAVRDALAAALEDIAEMWQRPDGAWVAIAECSHLTAFTCIEKHPDDPGEWCPVCVAEVAWCAWKMGALG